ncbi:hypothetical protein X737_09500 [Mesorhizobium sp. L48C026A00]|nr:hypothetical protein X737_09500 [Mesorhizobium sp. L48C026A00]
MDRADRQAWRQGAPNHDPAIRKETSQRYGRCHPGHSFAELVRRSSFSKEDRRLLEN